MGGIADSGLVIRVTKSRVWIGLMAGLLIGIVALNVMALSFNASASKTAALSDRLRQENQALRSEITGGLSNERLQHVAARMGLVVPEPGSIRYLTPSAGDAAAAAARLRRGDITIGTVAAAEPVLPAEPVAQAETTVVDPAAAAPAEAAPTTTAVVPAPATQPTDTLAAPVVETGGAVAP